MTSNPFNKLALKYLSLYYLRIGHLRARWPIFPPLYVVISISNK